MVTALACTVESGPIPPSQPWGLSTTETIHSKGGGSTRDVVLKAVTRVIHIRAHYGAQQSVGPCILPNPERAWDTGWGELIDGCYRHQDWNLRWRPFGN